MKPSLHELITDYIYNNAPCYDIDKDGVADLAEQIIKIIRDYYLDPDDSRHLPASANKGMDFEKENK